MDPDAQPQPTISALSRLLDGAVAAQVAPAVQACVIRDGAVVHSSAHGALPGGAPVGRDARFDVASVSKLVTTAMAAALAERRALDLDAPVRRVLPGFTGKDAVTPRHLLAHTSGLPAWEPLFARCAADPIAGALFPAVGLEGARRTAAVERSRRILVEAALSAPLAGRTGERVYSDLGFVALGRLLEAAGGAGLAELADHLVLAPLGLRRTGYVDLSAPDLAARLAADRFVPTGGTRPRAPAPGQEGRFAIAPQAPALDLGQVDDDNAYALGGIAGHAGIFSTAEDVARLGQLLLEEIDGAGRLGAGATLGAFARPSPALSGPARGLGFDLPAGAGSAAGARFGKGGPRGAVGHLGFTGCSLWIDLDRRLSAALLTNRVFLGRANVEGIQRLRPEFHDLAIEAVQG
jgi:CubicO group peptidase (beta-lactamase class C family)